MKDLVAHIATALVDRPEDVEVRETGQDETLVLELKVAKEDLGKVIGKQGRTARALRTLLSATAGKSDRKVRLEIVE
ncbi:MAG: KH domain-containing protein [Thermodesulfobacteriota bacterium]